MPSSTALVSLKDAALNVGPTSYLLPLEKLVPEMMWIVDRGGVRSAGTDEW